MRVKIGNTVPDKSPDKSVGSRSRAYFNQNVSYFTLKLKMHTHVCVPINFKNKGNYGT